MVTLNKVAELYLLHHLHVAKAQGTDKAEDWPRQLAAFLQMEAREALSAR